VPSTRWGFGAGDGSRTRDIQLGRLNVPATPISDLPGTVNTISSFISEVNEAFEVMEQASMRTLPAQAKSLRNGAETRFSVAGGPHYETARYRGAGTVPQVDSVDLAQRTKRDPNPAKAGSRSALSRSAILGMGFAATYPRARVFIKPGNSVSADFERQTV
jgi:phage gpG-like protein